MKKANALQFCKSVIFLLLGAIPGCVLYFSGGLVGHLSVVVLGALVGFAFSFRSVSAERVMGAVAASIVAKNAPSSMRGEVFDAMVPSNDGETEIDADNFSDEGFANFVSAVKKRSVVASWVSGVAVALLVLIVILTADADKRLSLVVLFYFPFLAAFGMATMTTGLLYLFAPTSVFNSKDGQELLAKVGTQNITVARLLIFIALVLGSLLIAVFVFLGLDAYRESVG